ncbi:MAG: ABC transporter ATP-binding protein [Deltaproteobacteria bacterium]|nr:MAG: ABC transporter ATP-binding protein [Deltaproteobacteria bacterium]
MTHPSIIHLLSQLFRHIERRRRYQFLLMFALTVLSSFAEVVSLGAVVPFIGVLIQPTRILDYPVLAGFTRSIGVVTVTDTVLLLTVTFAVAVIIAGSLRLILLRFSIRLANATGADLSLDVYRRTLYQQYHVHVARNSSEIISSISQKIGSVASILISLVTVASSSLLFFAILMTLFVIDPIVATISLVSLGFSYGIIALMYRRRLIINSNCIAKEQTQVIKSLQEGLGAIRDVLLDGTQNIYCEVYRKAIQKLLFANGENSYLNQSPRYSMEAVGMVLIAILANILSHRPGGVAAALPVLGGIALGAQRLLPLLQQLYGGWSNIAGNQGSLVDVLHLLDQPLENDICETVPSPFQFQSLIHFNHVYFRYVNNSPWVLKDINLTITKGLRVGFFGSTGSGKSTLLDLFMFLLEPTQGEFLVDGIAINSKTRRSWQRIIAHVPQNIYLADATIAENIAFGVPLEQIDLECVRASAAQAQIAGFIESQMDGYNVVVGERGIRLSGGQRQRIGIARALYKQAKVLVFDEATSALDNITETEVMSAIEDLNRDLTILIIAHRLTTLQYCDIIVRLEHGEIVEQGTYEYFRSKGFSAQGLVKKVGMEK